MVIIIRIQMHLKPYKLKQNNWIELVGLLAGTITMYSALIFNVEGGALYGFYQMGIVIVFFANAYFVVHWLFLLLCSLEWNNHHYQRFLKIFGLIL
jgi:hypothetical protein